jgi:hypothetical protein
MEIPSSSKYPKDHIDEQSERDFSVAFSKMPLSYLTLRYGFSVLGLLVGSMLLMAIGAILLVPVWYIFLGIFMSRVVERVVVWNQYLASLADIARVKRSIWIGWFYGIPRLIWDIWVVERM